jgi:hypothetical protein
LETFPNASFVCADIIAADLVELKARFGNEARVQIVEMSRPTDTENLGFRL